MASTVNKKKNEKTRSAGRKKKNTPKGSRNVSSILWVTLVALIAAAAYPAMLYYRYWNSVSPVVHVTQGDLQGREAETNSGTLYYAFQGIPYAQPPIGEFRFKEPRAPVPWSGIFDARADGSICPQPLPNMPVKFPDSIPSLDEILRQIQTIPTVVHRIIAHYQQSENCLCLNVFTTTVDKSAARPVLVWVHGGAFSVGDGGLDVQGPQHFLDQGLVVVTLNYRLGVLGFFNVDHPDVVANNGLRDVQAALEWVRDNIANFGGDPGRVTLAGESAGAVIAHYLSLAPSAKGLFHRLILQSGSALHHWGFARPQDVRHRAQRLAMHFGISPDDTDALVKRMKTVDAATLTAAILPSIAPEEYDLLMDEFPFQPSVDGDIVPAPPPELIRAGLFAHVPTILGINNREGMFSLLMSHVKGRSIESHMQKAEDDFWLMLPEYLRDLLPQDSSKLAKVAAEAKKLYFDGQPINNQSLQQYIDIYGDLFFVFDTHRLLRELVAVSDSPVYAYNFTMDGRLNFYKRLCGFKHAGASHGDELGYIFDISVLPSLQLQGDDPEQYIREFMTSKWANFAATGNPNSVETKDTIQWPAATARDHSVLNIGYPITIQDQFNQKTMHFWDKVLIEATSPSRSKYNKSDKPS